MIISISQPHKTDIDLSRTLAAATATTSILVYSGILSGKYVIYYTPWLFKFPPEIWRLVTSFWVTGPQLGILLDTYFCKFHPGSEDIWLCGCAVVRLCGC